MEMKIDSIVIFLQTYYVFEAVAEYFYEYVRANH